MVVREMALNWGRHQEMLRRMELRKKKEDKIEADKLDQHNAVADKKREFHGTPVTVESFAAWKEKFETEMRGTQNASQKDEATAKLTGRQLWSKGLVTEDDAAEAEAEGDDDEEEGDEDGDEQEEEEEEEGEQAK
ncbi:hypothetical protein BBJ28_00006750 [Nothophytophthora sp. Chile5]|nr:hypothetical protein BBJ28_00006750 [Nothophytophthora sp. Chile5]